MAFMVSCLFSVSLFFRDTLLQVFLVSIKALVVVDATDFHVWLGRQQLHQMAHLDRDAILGQHRDIGGLNEKKQSSPCPSVCIPLREKDLTPMSC